MTASQKAALNDALNGRTQVRRDEPHWYAILIDPLPRTRRRVSPQPAQQRTQRLRLLGALRVTPAQQDAMREGRIRAHQQRTANAIERVRQYTLWLANGSVPRLIPEVPSDNDYRLARGRQG